MTSDIDKKSNSNERRHVRQMNKADSASKNDPAGA